jgi:hypothetical protein
MIDPIRAKPTVPYVPPVIKKFAQDATPASSGETPDGDERARLIAELQALLADESKTDQLDVPTLTALVQIFNGDGASVAPAFSESRHAKLLNATPLGAHVARQAPQPTPPAPERSDRQKALLAKSVLGAAVLRKSRHK